MPDPSEKKALLVNRLLMGNAVTQPSLCEWHMWSGDSHDPCWKEAVGKCRKSKIMADSTIVVHL